MSWQLWLAFASLQFMFAITPGPAVVLVASQAAARGWRAGFEGALGVQLGNGVYFVISALGLGVALAASETAFQIIKTAGALYLVWLGLKTFASASQTAEQPDAAPSSLWRRPFTQSLVNQLANPKSILFFGALFPQFIDPDAAAPLAQFLVMGITMVAIELPILALYALAGAQGRRLGGRRAAAWRERVCGVSLIGVGAALATLKATA